MDRTSIFFETGLFRRPGRPAGPGYDMIRASSEEGDDG